MQSCGSADHPEPARRQDAGVQAGSFLAGRRLESHYRVRQYLGRIFMLGVEDGAKKVKGVPDVLAEEERLANLIADSISPKPLQSWFPQWK
jgi:hypothetical protein